MRQRRPSRWLAALALLGAAAGPPDAAARFDPAHRWRAAATAHFEVLFPAGAEELAARAAAIAEEAHELLAPRMGWVPKERTRLILTDDADVAGGWASPYPYNQIAVQATPPGAESALGGAARDEWLRLVIIHEYAHVLQLDMVTGGAPRAVNAVFGRLWFPNALEPLWLVEGLAVHEETELTAGGRGRLPAAEMVLRMASLEGPFPQLDDMAVRPDRWPAGQVPYLFGESFLRFLAGRYGRERLAELSLRHASRNLPWLIESTGRRVLGAGYRDLWREWSGELRARHLREAADLEAAGLTPSEPLTDAGWANLAPAWSPDGGRIAWLSAGEEASPGVWIMDAGGGGRRRLVAAPFSSAGLSWSRDGARLYYARLDLERGAAVRSGIRAWDFPAGREVEVTRGLRARDPDVSPDGKELLVVTIGAGHSRLVALPLDRGLPVEDPALVRGLTPASETQYEGPRWSPDGARLAVALRRADGTSAVAVLSRDGAPLAEFPCGRAAAGPPAWSPDGRFVYFASDRTGIFNLFAWDPAAHRLRQVTNVLGGAFSPAPSPDGRRLAFASYSGRGFDIHRLEADPPAWRDPGPPRAAPPLPPAIDAPPLASAPYRPLDTLVPRLWVPWAAASPESGTLAGFLTGSQDASQRHRYLAAALYGPETGRLLWLLDYSYDGLLPTLRLDASDSDVLHAGLLGGGDYVERRTTAAVEASFPLGSLEAPSALSLGYRHRHLSGLTALPAEDGERLPARGDLGSARIAWSRDGTERPRGAVSPERGGGAEIALERFQEGLGSDRSFTRVAADWSHFLPLPPRHHVLRFRLAGGASSGDVPLQGAFRIGGDAPGAIAGALEDESLPARGYPPGVARGDHALVASLEYRFPLAFLGRGGVSAPFYLRRLHGALFLEGGSAWSGDPGSAEVRRSAGAELRLDLFFSYALPVTLRAGVAYGFDRDGGLRPLAGIWLARGLGSTAAAGRR